MRGRAGKADEMGSSSKRTNNMRVSRGYHHERIALRRQLSITTQVSAFSYSYSTRTCVDEVCTFLCRDGVCPFRRHLSFYVLGHHFVEEIGLVLLEL